MVPNSLQGIRAGQKWRPLFRIALSEGNHSAGRGFGEQKHALSNMLSLQVGYTLKQEIIKSKKTNHKLYYLKQSGFKFPIQ